MKEVRFFYDPAVSGELPREEAQHAVRVLRLAEGDELNLMDGCGCYYRAVITAATNHRCLYKVLEKEEQNPAWRGHIHLAMAPTKLNDRVEWFAEKATEVGINELSFVDCRFSERHVIKTERVDKILISAMKQSHKAWKPLLNEMMPFGQFVSAPRNGQKFICHCYEMADILPAEELDMLAKQYGSPKLHLLDVLDGAQDALVMIGPEGDFSVDEVREATRNGFLSVTLGSSRLRTETAALVAVDMMQWKHQR